MNTLFWVIFIIAAFFAGVIVGRSMIKIDGLFIVDDSDYETTRWTLDVWVDPKTIPNKKNVRLKVKKMDEGVV